MLSKEKLFPFWFEEQATVVALVPQIVVRDIGLNRRKVKETGICPEMAHEIGSIGKKPTYGFMCKSTLLKIGLQFSASDEEAHGVDRLVIEPDFVMNVGSGGAPGTAGLADNI